MKNNKYVTNFSNHINLFFDNPFYYSNGKQRRAFFLDRDGVLIKDRHYISNPNEVSLEEGVLDFLSYLFDYGIPVVVITNQSGIARGIFSWNDYELVTERLFELLGNKNPIIGIFANGLKSNSFNNSWRKPNPDMIFAASYLLNIDVENSFLIGDRLTDIQAADKAGIRNIIHVRTGHGRKERENVEKFFMNQLHNQILSDKERKIMYCENLNSYGQFFTKKYKKFL